MKNASGAKDQNAKNRIVISSNKVFSNRRKVFFVLIVLGVLGASLFYWMIGGGVIEQAKMASYLKNKYGAEFNVTNVHTEGAGLGMSGVQVASAHPVNNGSLHFKVVDRGSNNFSDEYLNQLWSKQAEELLGKFIDSNLTNISSYKFEVLPEYNLTNTDYPTSGSTINVKDALRTYSSQLKSTVWIKSSEATDNNQPSESELRRAFIFLTFLSELGISNGTASYVYTEPTYTEKNKYGDLIYRYKISLNADRLRDINNPDQLKEYFSDRTKEGM